MSESILRCDNLAKRFGDQAVLEAISLEVQKGEFFALLGPSGSGKTTLLRLLAGFERPDAGSIQLGQRTIADEKNFLPPEQRRIGMVFQDYALFPHMTVEQNIGYGLVGCGAVEQRIEQMLNLTGLSALRGKHPNQLSGGEQQRVALARALAPSPQVLLLDEPFSNLDAALRRQMRSELKRLIREAGTTAILVTHDQEEALSLSDRIGVLIAGCLQQTDIPEKLYWQPANRTVATFLGDANVLCGECKSGKISCELGTFSANKGQREGDVWMMLRPESLVIAEKSGIKATVRKVDYFGHDLIIWVQTSQNNLLQIRTLGLGRLPSVGEALFVKLGDGQQPHFLG